jgi:hypothetical protein
VGSEICIRDSLGTALSHFQDELESQLYRSSEMLCDTWIMINDNLGFGMINSRWSYSNIIPA